MLDFVSKENERHRDYFGKLFEKTAWVLGILIASVAIAATFIGWNTIGGAKQTAQDVAKTQAQESAKEEIAKQFENPKIELLVREEAQRATATTAKPIIKDEVDKQVKLAVKTEQVTIREALKNATGKAVEQLRGSIEVEANKQMKAIINTEIQPQLNMATAYNKVKEYNALAQQGTAEFFDQLEAMSRQNDLDKGLRAVAIADVKSLESNFEEHYSGVIPCPDQPPNLAIAGQKLASQDPQVYAQYLDCFNQFKIRNLYPNAADNSKLSIEAMQALHTSFKSLDRLVEIMTTAPMLDQRRIACDEVISVVMTANPDLRKGMPKACLDKVSYLGWWKSHRNEFVQ